MGGLAISLHAWQAKGCGTSGNSPFRAAFEIGSLVQFGGKIEEVDFCGGSVGIGNDDKRVDLEVGELAVDVDGV
jgi:hypothetical protein